MTGVAVIVPVLNRPERVAPLLESLRESEVDATLTPYFVVTATDIEEIRRLIECRAEWILGEDARKPGDYARKVNRAARVTSEPWLFLGADDLRFYEGWADAAIRQSERTRCRVIGTNDLGNSAVMRGRHSTHSLVARSYVDEMGTIDQPGQVLFEGYDHQFCDNEFVETAMSRGEFAFSRAAVVEHLHPHWGKGPNDETYRLAMANTIGDRQIFRTRRRKWSGGQRRVNAAKVRR